MLEMDINGCKRCWHKTCPRNLWVMAFHSFSFSAASLVISFNADLWTVLSFISFTLVHEIFATFKVSCKRKVMLPVTFFSHTWPNSCYYCFFLSLFLLNFSVLPYYFLSILFAYLLSWYSSFFISLSYPDLSHCDTDDGTRTLDPHWWRVNKPSQGVPEAMLDYRPKEGWLKGILIKRKSRGKTTWWQSEKFNLALESFWFLLPSLSSVSWPYRLILTITALESLDNRIP